MTSFRLIALLRSEKGQLLEVVIGVVFIALIMLGIAEIMMKHSRETTMLKRFDQSKQLADMVLDQYNAWTGSQAKGMNEMVQHNFTNVPAGTFFGTAGDMGFHEMTLTTKATCLGNLSTGCTVEVGVNSAAGGLHKYTRTFTAQMTDHVGATVDVWVLDPTCDPTKPELYPTCGGKGGFLVTASSSAVAPANGNVNLFGTTEVATYTQKDGHAILRNVAVNVPLVITARQAGSAVYDQVGAPTQGYYVAGTTFTTDSQPFTAQPFITNLVPPFQKFLPLGTVTGHLTNLSNAVANTQMMVVLQSTASTGFGLQYNPTWNVLTDPNGNFKFANVLPGTFQLYAAGDPGTNVAIPPVPSGNTFYFRQGFSNHHAFPGLLPTPAAMTTPTTTAVAVNIQRLGALHLVVDPGWKAAHPNDNVTFTTRLPPTLFRHSVLISTTAILPMDFYNVFDEPNSSITLSGLSVGKPGTASAGQVDGYFAHLIASGLNPAVDNTIKITPQPSYTFQGTLRNAPAAPPWPAGATVTLSCAAGLACSGGVTGVPLGTSFSLTGFTPQLSGPTMNQFLMVIDFGVGAAKTATVSGDVIDTLDNAKVPAVTLTDGLIPPHTTTVANGAGHFNLVISNTRQAYYVLVTFSCPTPPVGAAPPVGAVCTAVPANGGVPAAGEIYVDSSLIGDGLFVDSTFGGSWNQYYQYPSSFVHTNTMALATPRKVALVNYGLVGSVQEAVTHIGIGQIKVCDKSFQLDLSNTGVAKPSQPNPPKNGQCVWTDNAGNYAFPVNALYTTVPKVVPVSVSNRYIDSTGVQHPGFVEVYVPSNQFSQTTGKSYSGGDSGQIDLPVPAVPGIAASLPAKPIYLSPTPGSI